VCGCLHVRRLSGHSSYSGPFFCLSFSTLSVFPLDAKKKGNGVKRLPVMCFLLFAGFPGFDFQTNGFPFSCKWGGIGEILGEREILLTSNGFGPNGKKINFSTTFLSVTRELLLDSRPPSFDCHILRVRPDEADLMPDRTSESEPRNKRPATKSKGVSIVETDA